MKNKYLSVLTIFLCLIIAVSFVGCGKKGDKTGDFTLPDGYATVVQIKINPTVNLYLDANQVILAVEYVNEDAKSSYKKIESSLVGANLTTAVDLVIETAAADGYLVENKEVIISIVETKAEDTNNLILKTANDAAKSTLQEIQVEATVNVDKGVAVPEDVLNSANTTTSTHADASSEESTSSTENAVTETVNSSQPVVNNTSSEEAKVAVVRTDVKYRLIKADPFDEERLTVRYFKFLNDGQYVAGKAPFLVEDRYVSSDGSVAEFTESVTYKGKTYYVTRGWGGTIGDYVISSDKLTLYGGYAMEFKILNENEIQVVKVMGTYDGISPEHIFSAYK